jgi:hypothetical protein
MLGLFLPAPSVLLGAARLEAFPVLRIAKKKGAAQCAAPFIELAD